MHIVSWPSLLQGASLISLGAAKQGLLLLGHNRAAATVQYNKVLAWVLA